MYYDPMIAKLVRLRPGPGRPRSARLGAGARRLLVRGVGHNIPFLAAVLANPRFARGG